MTTESDEPRRVVITGIGATTAAGPTTPDLWAALLERRACLTSFPTPASDPPRYAGQIQDYAGPGGVPPRFLERLGRAAQFALDASIQAIADARITFSADNAYQVAAIVGTAHGSGAEGAAGFPFLSGGLSGVTIGLNIAGPAYAVAADGASGASAILQAAQLIQNGSVSAALAGGAEAPLRPEVYAAYAAAGLLSSQAHATAHRPFDRRRDGALLGEGAAMLLLEDRAIAVQRGARIYAELLGGAQTSGPPGDGSAPTDVEVARRAVGDALRHVGRNPGEIDIVFTAGLGTPAGDRRETDILERSFGSRIQDMYVTAVTPTVGYTVGAAGAISAAAAALSLAEGIVPPHASYEEIDPDCGLDIARQSQRDHLHGAVVSAYGALGQNVALLLARHQAEPGDEVAVVA